MLGPVDLGGARQRLLPDRIPMQFFGAAVVGHVFAWLGLAINADDLAHFAGGPGPVLAAVHVLTLGVLVPTAMGASLQMLPVALGRPAPPARVCDAVFWLTLAGAVALICGFATLSRPAIHAGAVVIAGGIAAYAMTVGRVVGGAREPRPMVLHVWAALAALTTAAALALTLSFDASAVLADHARVAAAHLVLAAFGFMGMLALGFSHVLIPMFAIAEAPGGWTVDVSFAAVVTAVAAGDLGLLIGIRWLLAAAVVAGLAGCGLHIALVARSLAKRVRRRLGPEFILIRASWGLLLATLALAFPLTLDLLPVTGPALFGFLLLFGWLLTLLTGVLQRILPFLASMHTARAAGRTAAPTKLTDDRPLAIHRFCHFVAVATVALGIAYAVPGVVLAGAVVGTIGAVAFAGFAVTVFGRMRAHLRARAVQEKGGRMIKSSSEVARTLHQEHLDTLAAMNTLEEMIHGEARDRPPDLSGGTARQQLGTLIAAIDHDIDRHFEFEEQHLFPVLDLAGFGDMTAMLIQEHDAIRPLAERLRSLATHALQDGFEKAAWREFRETAMDLAPTVMFHIQKEEMGVIRRLDVLLDAATDKQLADRHAERTGQSR